MLGRRLIGASTIAGITPPKLRGVNYGIPANVIYGVNRQGGAKVASNWYFRCLCY